MNAQRKIASATTLARIVHQARARGQRVIFTNGCFDLVHAGHVRLLERAKRYGDLLIVGLNSDRSVRALKGAPRPILRQQERALVLAAFESVDYVTIFNELTPERLVARLQPDVLIKGSDWGAKHIVGRDLVEQRGGRVVRFPFMKGQSTTQLIERIRQR